MKDFDTNFWHQTRALMNNSKDPNIKASDFLRLMCLFKDLIDDAYVWKSDKTLADIKDKIKEGLICTHCYRVLYDNVYYCDDFVLCKSCCDNRRIGSAYIKSKMPDILSLDEL